MVSREEEGLMVKNIQKESQDLLERLDHKECLRVPEWVVEWGVTKLLKKELLLLKLIQTII